MNIQLNLFWAVILLVIGLYLLFKSADWLVSGAVSISKRLNIQPIVIGLTVVAIGTSAPEVAASIVSAIKSAGNVAIGNVYGSNIANLALIAGFCSILRPLKIKAGTIKREIYVMVVVALLLYPLIIDKCLSRWNGILLLTIFLILLGLTVFESLSRIKANPEEQVSIAPEIQEMQELPSCTKSISLILLGIFSMAVGAKFTVESGIFIGKYSGLSDAIIGNNNLAIGTSLPELVTCIVAAYKGHDDISIGNLVGSNVFNTLLVCGTAGIVRPIILEDKMVGSYYWLMVAISIVFAALISPRLSLGRAKGSFLLICYLLYMAYLFCNI